MKPVRIIALSLTLAPGALFAGNSVDSISGLQLVRTAEAPVQLRPIEVFSPNPAAMAHWRKYSYSDIAVKGALKRSDRARVEQEGTGHSLGNVMASSYIHLSESTTVWGEARFTTGRYHDLKWTNSVDYELVAPYVMGDSVGGDLSTRQYAFMGGYAGTAGRWSWGAQAAYRAEIDYRNRDPRDKIVVSDLSIHLGGAYRLGHYTIGLGGALRVYNQESKVEFYKPNNDIRAYALLGLGSIYSRFGGNDDLDSSYSGLGYGGSIQFFPTSGSGIMAGVEFGYIRLGQCLRDYNNLELTSNHTGSLTANVAYTAQIGAWKIAPQIRFSGSRRNGFENLFGPATGGTYPEIGSRENYHADRVEATLELPVSVQTGEFVWSATPSATYHYQKETLVQPNRLMQASGVRPGLKLGGEYAFGLNMIRVNVAGSHNFSGDDKIRLTGLSMASDIARSVMQNYRMAVAAVNQIGCLVSYDRELPQNIVLGVALRGSHSHYQGLGNINVAEAAVSVRF